jgi:hypothetical protein
MNENDDSGKAVKMLFRWQKGSAILHFSKSFFAYQWRSFR